MRPRVRNVPLRFGPNDDHVQTVIMCGKVCWLMFIWAIISSLMRRVCGGACGGGEEGVDGIVVATSIGHVQNQSR